MVWRPIWPTLWFIWMLLIYGKAAFVFGLPSFIIWSNARVCHSMSRCKQHHDQPSDISSGTFVQFLYHPTALHWQVLWPTHAATAACQPVELCTAYLCRSWPYVVIFHRLFTTASNMHTGYHHTWWKHLRPLSIGNSRSLFLLEKVIEVNFKEHSNFNQDSIW